MNHIELPPRIHCFDGPRVSLNDVCGKSEECKIEECLWHRNKGEISPTLGADNNRTESMPKIG